MSKAGGEKKGRELEGRKRKKKGQGGEKEGKREDSYLRGGHLSSHLSSF